VYDNVVNDPPNPEKAGGFSANLNNIITPSKTQAQPKATSF